MEETDHRIRVAAGRRDRMRRHLQQSSLTLLATVGPEGAVIDDIIRAAAVSRGTFYKYYAAPADLVRELAVQLADDMITAVNQLTLAQEDPAVRAALGLRAILGFVGICPKLGGFIVRAGWPISDPSHAFFRMIGPNVDEGLRTGRFLPRPRELYLTLIGGLAVGAIHEMTCGRAAPDFAEEAAEMLLCGLGLDPAEARALSRLPMALPVLPAGSLLDQVIAAQTARPAVI